MPNNIIDELSIKISAEAASALSAIEDLASRLGDLSTAISSLSGVRITSFITPAATRQIAELGKAIDSFNIDKANAFSSTINALSSLGGGVHFRVSGFTALANGIEAVNLTKLRAIAAVDFSNFNSITEAGKSLSSLTSQLNKLDRLMKRVEKSQAALSTSTRSVSRETKKAHHSFSLANTALGKLLNSIKRIAFYRAIRSAIRAVTQGFAEGIEHLYRWSQAWNTSFAPAMDQLATAQLYLKNGFASMFSPLIEYAIPIIDRLIDRLVDMFNVVQELFARLTGAETWNKAIKYPVKYKEDLDDAAGSAKALQNILMDFDEINAINTPTSGSRGSAKEAEDYSKMFELMETSASSPFFEKFGDLFSDIGEKIGKALEIGKKFWEFVKGLNFKPLETSLSNLWSTLSPIIDELLGDADWFREKVLQPITQFLVEKGIPAAIDTVRTAISELWKAFQPFREGIKHFWDENGEWIMELLQEQYMKSLDKIKESFKLIGQFFQKNSEKIKGIFANLSSAASYFSPLIKAIAGIIGTAAWDSFIDGIRNTLDLLQPILDVISGIFKLVNVFVTGDANTFKDGMKDIGTAIWSGLIYPFKEFLRGLASVLDAVGTVFPACKDAAHHIRVMIGDETNEIIKEVEGTGVAIVGTADNVWKAVDTKTGEYVSITGKRISSAQNEINKELGSSIGYILKFGSEGAKSSEQVQKWLKYCTEYGVDPYTGEIIWATEETLKVGKAGQTAAQELRSAFDSASRTTANDYWYIQRNASEAAKASYNAWYEQFGKLSDIAVRAGRSFGRALSDNIQSSVRGINIPATVQIKALQNQITLDKKMENILYLDTRGMRGFASGGFPSPSSLFFAGESGIPELLGTIGGRTAVAGGEEITGIRDAIYEQGQREEGLLRQLISAVANKDLTLVANSKTGRWVNQSLKAYAGVSG